MKESKGTRRAESGTKSREARFMEDYANTMRKQTIPKIREAIKRSEQRATETRFMPYAKSRRKED